MVRSVIPDSDDDSGGETSPYNFSSTIRPAEGAQQSPSARLTVPKSDNADTAAATTQDNAEAQLILGTGSTDSAVFQQIYTRHQLSTNATLSTPASQPNNHESITQIILDHSTPTLSIQDAAQLTPQRAQEVDLFGTTSSANTVKKLKRSKTSINDSSFTSAEATINTNEMKHARSMKSYPYTIETSSQDIVVSVADTGSFTTLTRGSQEGNLKYKKTKDENSILGSGNASHADAEKDIYDFPGSSATGPMNRVTKKMGAKTTMDIAKEKMKTYGKARRSKTMVAPSSQNTPSEEKRKDDNDERLDMGSTRMRAHNPTRLPSSPQAVQQKEQAPRRSLAENIQRKKEEKAEAEREKAAAGTAGVGEQAEVVSKDAARASSPAKTYGKVKRSKTGMPVSSSLAADDNHSKRSVSDTELDAHKKRKSDVPFELLKAKRSKTTTAATKAAQSAVVVLGSSQDDPVDQIPDTIVTPTASMPVPLLKTDKNTVLVPGTKSSDKSTLSNKANAVISLQVNSKSPLEVDSKLSVVKATKSSGNKSSGDKPFSTGNDYPSTPKLPCFDSSQEQADTIKSVIKKVDELVNSPAPAPVPAPAATQISSPLAISFDKGLVGQSIIVVIEPTDSQKEQYAAVSVTESEGDGQEHAATLPPVMSPARVRRWSGASSTVANSTWKDRDSGGHSDHKRAPTMEPLSSQPIPSSRRPNKRSKTGLEDTTPCRRRGRSVSVHSNVPPSLGGSDVVVKSSSRKVRRSKTMTASDEPATSSSQPRRTHVVKTVTTYEKLKDPDASPLSSSEVGASTKVVMENTQIESRRGTKRKSDVAELDVSQDPLFKKGQDKTQEELDFEMAKKLQEKMDKDDAEPETRAKRRAPFKVDLPRPEPEPTSSQEMAGLPPPEMYKPRLSSRRSKSLSAKADISASETFIDGLPRPKKARGKKAASQKEVISAQELKAADKENVEPPKESVPNVGEQSAIVDIDMDDAPAPVDDEDRIVVTTAMPKPIFNREMQVNAEAAPAELYPVPEKIGKAATKPAKAACLPEEDDDEDAVVAPKKRGRGAKAAIDSDESADELAVMEVIEQPVVPTPTARGRAAQKRAATAAAAKVPPKPEEVLDSDDDEDEDEDLPVKTAGRASRSKAAGKPAPPKPTAKSKEIVDTDASGDEAAAVVSKPASPAKARTPSLKPRAGGVTRKAPTPGFKAPTMARGKSTSVETDVPQTPRKDKEKGSQEMTPQNTPPGATAGAASHSPLRGGVVPLRVGLSKKTRLPSLLKIIRK